MTISDFLEGLKYLYGPLVVFLAITSLLFSLIAKKSAPKTPIGGISFIIAFGFLGSITGLIAGVSQEPIISAMLTGLLGLISALLAYLLGKESLKEWRPIIPLGMIFLMVGTLFGLSCGGTYKFKRADYNKDYSRRLLLYEKVDLEVCKQERLMRLRGEPISKDYKDISCPQ
ncbi:MAG: hypothetical protein WBB19_19895 [Desulforhopalus sp.]